MAISPIGPRDISLRDPQPAANGEAFAAAFERVISEANQAQVDAHQAVNDLVVRGEGTLHDAMVAMQSAEGQFRLLMEMRNRLIDGVTRLMQTQI